MVWYFILKQFHFIFRTLLVNAAAILNLKKYFYKLINKSHLKYFILSKKSVEHNFIEEQATTSKYFRKLKSFSNHNDEFKISLV